MMKNNRITFFENLIFISLLILFFQNLLITHIPFFGYFDELVAIISICYFLLKLRHLEPSVKKNLSSIFSLMVIIIFTTLSFNIFFGIQPSIIGIIEDILSLFKFIFIFLGCKTFINIKKIKFSNLFIKRISLLTKIYITVLFAFSILNFFTDIGMSEQTRFGLRCFSFIYGTAGHIINQMTYALVIFNAEKIQLKTSNTKWVALALIIMLTTIKARAAILVFLYLALNFILKTTKKNATIGIITISIIAILIGIPNFKGYFLTEGTPRQMFVAGSLELVQKYFPFGTGFATFGSSAAAKHYSQLYYDLGFYTRRGMTPDPDSQQYINDNYLPTVFAELGLFLGVLFLTLLAKCFLSILNDSIPQNNKIIKAMSLFIIFDLIFSSIQSSYLSHYSVVTISLLYFLLIHNSIGKKE